MGWQLTVGEQTKTNMGKRAGVEEKKDKRMKNMQAILRADQSVKFFGGLISFRLNGAGVQYLCARFRVASKASITGYSGFKQYHATSY